MYRWGVPVGRDRQFDDRRAVPEVFFAAGCTFTIGFEEAGFNEAEDAKAVASTRHGSRRALRHRQRDARRHSVVVVDVRRAVRRLIADPDVPRQLLRPEQVTVALTGDGGDELFAGYNCHLPRRRFGGTCARSRNHCARQSVCRCRLPTQFWRVPPACSRVGAGHTSAEISGKRWHCGSSATSTSSIRVFSTNGASRNLPFVAVTRAGRVGTWIARTRRRTRFA